MSGCPKIKWIKNSLIRKLMKTARKEMCGIKYAFHTYCNMIIAFPPAKNDSKFIILLISESSTAVSFKAQSFS